MLRENFEHGPCRRSALSSSNIVDLSAANRSLGEVLTLQLLGGHDRRACREPDMTGLEASTWAERAAETNISVVSYACHKRPLKGQILRLVIAPVVKFERDVYSLSFMLMVLLYVDGGWLEQFGQFSDDPRYLLDQRFARSKCYLSYCLVQALFSYRTWPAAQYWVQQWLLGVMAYLPPAVLIAVEK
uniref:Uncharacterized protein n=1 Tax=Timema genevievae TaxID=629358 RepID=A0A7R9K9A8_TIMGE|nr:unnamed protein product [Timema genevievae]